MTEPSVLIPVAPGTNRDHEMALAFQAAGARTSQVPLEALRRGEVKVLDHQLLALPGGFSYGDALGAGRLLGLDLAGWFADELQLARERAMPIIGICNGFQALVRSGLLPGSLGEGHQPGAGLMENANGRFECRWVDLVVESVQSPWLDGVDGPLRCPVAHGEGRFVTDDLAAIEASGLVAFRYGGPDGGPAGGAHPANPNGSQGDIAGIVDATGLVLGLMPHPEDHVFAHQDPRRRRRSALGAEGHAAADGRGNGDGDSAEGDVAEGEDAARSGSCVGLFAAGVRAVTG